MFQLVYFSFKSESFDPSGPNGIDEILQKANDFNKSKGITGMLLYKAGVFIQLIEGAKEDVLNLYGRIATDLRHES